eukprot:7972314-Prorocentrum_lima.AAC.1
MSQYGDIMPRATDERSGIGWIVLVCELTKELGMKLVWGSDKVTPEDQDGKEIILALRFGLPFMDWEDLL